MGTPDGYRPHLDGVRAGAVVLVILFHLGYVGFRGGFIGVDVFFVMSGYLITSLLLGQVTAGGTVGLRQFYARRMRRLLPAALLTLAGVMLLSTYLLTLADQRSVGHDLTFAALYGANWHFGASQVAYFAEGQVPSPLVHFWSLAVEEQFYLVWPALFIGLWKLGRRGRRTDGYNGLLAGIVVIGGASIAASLVFAHSNLSYYGTHTRAYQLLAGGGLAVVARRWGDRLPAGRSARRIGAAVVTVSALALVWMAHTIAGANDYPGLAGLWVTVASFALIAGLDLTPRGGAQRAFGSAVPAAVGRMSYSLYLWHWPVIVFAPLLATKWSMPLLSGRPAEVVLMFTLAALSYHLVERPIRFRLVVRAPSPAVLGTGMALSLAIALISVPVLQPKPGFSERALDAVAEQAVAGPCPYAADAFPAPKDSTPCLYHQGGPKVIALVGDSHAQQWLPAMAALAVKENFTLVRATRGGCPANDALSFGKGASGQESVDHECSDWRHTVYPELVARYDPVMIFVATRSHVKGLVAQGREVGRDDPAHLADWAATWDWTLRTLGSRGARIVVSDILPTIPVDVPSCLAKIGHKTTKCDFPVSADKVVPAYNAAINRLPSKYDNVAVVDPTPIACPHGLCPGMVGDIVVHRDDNHLTSKFVAARTEQLRELLVSAGAPL